MTESPRHWDAVLSEEFPLTALPPAMAKRALCFVTCGLAKDGGCKNPKTIERVILAYHFDGDATRPGAYIAKQLANDKGVNRRERAAGKALLAALRADPAAHAEQVERRLAALRVESATENLQADDETGLDPCDE